MIFFGVTTTECTLTLFVLSPRDARSFLLDAKCQSGFFVSTRKTSLRLILDARRSNQHFKVPPKIPTFSHVELLFWKPDEGEAPALQIASGDVQNAFHHMGVSEWLRPYFYLRPL